MGHAILDGCFGPLQLSDYSFFSWIQRQKPRQKLVKIFSIILEGCPIFFFFKFLSTVRTGHGTTDYFQIGKRVHQGCILSPLFNLYAEYIMRNAMLDEAQAGIKVAGRNIITSDMQMIPL